MVVVCDSGWTLGFEKKKLAACSAFVCRRFAQGSNQERRDDE